MALWKEVENRAGEKQHILVHPNTETVRVRTFSQDKRGKVGAPLDKFKMEPLQKNSWVVFGTDNAPSA